MAHKTSFRLAAENAFAYFRLLIAVSEGNDGSKKAGRLVSDVTEYMESKGIPFMSDGKGARGYCVFKSDPEYAAKVAILQAWNDAGEKWNDELVNAGIRTASSSPAKKSVEEQAITFLANALKADTKEGKLPNLSRIPAVRATLNGKKYASLGSAKASELFARVYSEPFIQHASALVAALAPVESAPAKKVRK